MARTTTVLQLTSVFVSASVFLGFPLLTLRIRVFKSVRRSSIILPVVRVDADVSLVLLVGEGTPHRLEVEDVEVDVSLHLF